MVLGFLKLVWYVALIALGGFLTVLFAEMVLESGPIEDSVYFELAAEENPAAQKAELVEQAHRYQKWTKTFVGIMLVPALLTLFYGLLRFFLLLRDWFF